MVTLRGRPVRDSSVGEDSGSGFGVGQLDDQTQEFISSEITRNILEQAHVIFGMIKEDIMEVLDEHLDSFHSEMVA